MAATRTSWNKDHFLLQAIYPDLFILMINDANFYLCLVKGDPADKGFKAYLEHPPQDADLTGILRVFFRKTDANLYAQLVAQAEGLDLGSIKRWEANYSEVLSYIRNLSMKHFTFGLKGIRAMTSVISDDDLVDVDLFWTNEPEKML